MSSKMNKWGPDKQKDERTNALLKLRSEPKDAYLHLWWQKSLKRLSNIQHIMKNILWMSLVVFLNPLTLTFFVIYVQYAQQSLYKGLPSLRQRLDVERPGNYIALWKMTWRFGSREGWFGSGGGWFESGEGWFCSGVGWFGTHHVPNQPSQRLGWFGSGVGWFGIFHVPNQP